MTHGKKGTNGRWNHSRLYHAAGRNFCRKVWSNPARARCVQAKPSSWRRDSPNRALKAQRNVADGHPIFTCDFQHITLLVRSFEATIRSHISVCSGYVPQISDRQQLSAEIGSRKIVPFASPSYLTSPTSCIALVPVDPRKASRSSPVPIFPPAEESWNSNNRRQRLCDFN